MGNRHNISEQEREELVAYLDGELGEEATRHIEANLSRDPMTRAEADSLRRAWEMLDHLPQAKPSAAFTSQTIERVSGLRPATMVAKASRTWQPWLVRLGLIAAVAVAAGAGFMGVSLLRSKATKADVSNSALAKEQRDPEEEWVSRLPRLVRDELERLPAEKRSARLAELKASERSHERDWQLAQEHWDDLQLNRPQLTRLSELQPDLKSFVFDSLWPLLSDVEQRELREAQDKFPLFVQTLVELVDKHPFRIPPAKKRGPARFSELPADVQERVSKLKGDPPPLVRRAEGRWPDYALAVGQYAGINKIRLPSSIGPCRPDDFIPSVERFVKEKLVPALTQPEKVQLSRVEGHWPRYPRVVIMLATTHRLQIPGMRLPGNQELWSRFRTKKPATGAEPSKDGAESLAE